MKRMGQLQTSRLILRQPEESDVEAIFERIGSDEEVTRFVGWARHTSKDDTKAFLEFSRSEWAKWPAGPLLMESRETGVLLGSSGLAYETAYRASTGYVLARDSWGRGFASEALRAVAAFANELGLSRLYAHCHVRHSASIRVLERCGFEFEGTLRNHLIFPNIGEPVPQDVHCYSRCARC
jgi:ribosomal-protein-alanine N-acetyltransferase